MSLPTAPQVRTEMLPRRARVLLGATYKVGKALALDTPLATPDGWTTMGAVAEGDVLFDRHGAATTVTAATDVMHDHPCIRVSMRSSEPIVADADHLWIVRRGNGERVVTTAELRVGDRLPVAGALCCDHGDLPLDPYSLGVWLGDGSSAAALVHLFSDDYDEIAAEMAIPLERRREKANTVTALMGRGTAQKTLRAVGLLNHKHIPAAYLRASEPQRMALLRGIMDTDGYVAPNGSCEITTVHERFACDILELASSLGLKAWSGQGRATIGGRDCGPKWRVTFHPGERPVCGLTRKRGALRGLLSTRTAYRRIVALDAIPSVPVRCIQVDSPTATYLAGREMVPTHNTTLLGTWAPKTTLIIDTQQGTRLLPGEHFVEHVTAWPEFVRVVNDIVKGGHPFHTIGLDLANDLWRFCDAYYGRDQDGIRTPASGMDDYQRSIKRATAAFNQQIGRLFAAPVGLWFVTHLRERMNIKGELMAYVPDMDKNVHAYIAGAVDFLWLAEADKKGRRLVHTQPTDHFEAGSRVPIPSPLPMDARTIATAMDRALNPGSYDADGNRIVEDQAPAAVEPTPEPPQPPPVRKDIERDTGRSDVPVGSDPWFDEIQPRLKDVPSQGLRVAVVAAGGTVPERVASWKATICALDTDQRRAFVEHLEALRSPDDPMPWDGAASPDTPGADDPGGQLDMADARAEAA